MYNSSDLYCRRSHPLIAIGAVQAIIKAGIAYFITVIRLLLYCSNTYLGCVNIFV